MVGAAALLALATTCTRRFANTDRLGPVLAEPGIETQDQGRHGVRPYEFGWILTLGSRADFLASRSHTFREENR
jgi:hypothetical protein